jgi:PAS domain S-box-containing protein
MSQTRLSAGLSAHHSRILMASLTLGALAMIAAVWWYYVRQRAAVEEDAEHELAAIAAMKSAQIENWRAERIGDGGVLAASPIMRTARRILAGGAVTQADRADFIAVFQALEKQFLYSGGALVDRQGGVRIGSSVNGGDSPRYQALAQAAQRAGKVTLSDLYRDPPVSGPVRMAVSIPVADLGAIVLNIDPSRFLYPYIASWPAASRTGETLIFRREGDYAVSLNDLRHSPGSTLNLRIRITMPRFPDDREFAAGFLRKATDYRGVPILSMVRSIQGSGWYLIAKVDQDEVYAPVTRLSWALALIVALIALANAAGVGYIWRNEQLRAHRERRALTGHFDSLTRYANDIIMLADESGRIVEVNQRAVEAYGYSEEELQSLPAEALRASVPGQPPLWPPGDESGLRYEAVHRRKDGSSFPVEISARTIEVEGAKYRQAIIRDISERARTEKEIKALSARLLNAQEEERSRLARELHDDISQQIAALSIGMSNLRKQIPAEQTGAREQSKRIQQNMAQVSESIRRLSHELHPAVLEHSGLGAALRDYCSEFGLLTHIQVSCKTDGCFGNMPPEVALCVFRVTQEALQNVAKHARVAQAEVELTRADGQICLTVSDRGAGMALDRAGMPAGLGLVSIKERTRLVNGTFRIRSEPNQGTTLSLKIPV